MPTPPTSSMMTVSAAWETIQAPVLIVPYSFLHFEAVESGDIHHHGGIVGRCCKSNRRVRRDDGLGSVALRCRDFLGRELVSTNPTGGVCVEGQDIEIKKRKGGVVVGGKSEMNHASVFELTHDDRRSPTRRGHEHRGRVFIENHSVIRVVSVGPEREDLRYRLEHRMVFLSRHLRPGHVTSAAVVGLRPELQNEIVHIDLSADLRLESVPLGSDVPAAVPDEIDQRRLRLYRERYVSTSRR